MQPVLAGCEASCKVATHEPLEFLELLDVVLDDVGADHIQLVQLSVLQDQSSLLLLAQSVLQNRDGLLAGRLIESRRN